MRAFVWGPVIGLMAVIFVASSSSDPGQLPEILWDKILHLTTYAVLGLLMIRALAGGRVRGVTANRAMLALLLTVLYGVADEFHQSFVPGRTPDLMDVVADAVGASIGVAAWCLMSAFMSRSDLRGERG